MKTKFIHSQQQTTAPMGKKRFVGFTAAYQVADNKLVLGLAICNEDDSFCKKMGRILSEGRMNKCPHIVPLIGEETPAETAREFANLVYMGAN